MSKIINKRILSNELFLFIFSCVIKMCTPNVEYQRINPTTQALVTSRCAQSCENATNVVIQWSIYRGFQTGYPNNDIQWSLFSNMDSYDNTLFFGMKEE